MKKTSNTIINIFLIFIVLGAVITAGIYGLRFFFRAGKDKRGKPSEHAIEEFKSTDPDLIC